MKPLTQVLHGAGICTPRFARRKSPSFVGKYTSTMDPMGNEKHFDHGINLLNVHTY